MVYRKQNIVNKTYNVDIPTTNQQQQQHAYDER